MNEVLLVVLGAVLASTSGLLLAWWQSRVRSRNAVVEAKRRWRDDLLDLATNLDVFVKRLPKRIPLTGPTLFPRDRYEGLGVFIRRYDQARDTILDLPHEDTRTKLHLIYGSLRALKNRIDGASCITKEAARDAELETIRDCAAGIIDAAGAMRSEELA